MDREWMHSSWPGEIPAIVYAMDMDRGLLSF